MGVEVPWAKLALGHVDFIRLPARPGTRVTFMCSPVQSRSLTANLQKFTILSNRSQIPCVKWTNGSRNQVQFPEFENWLSARLRYFQFATGIHKSIYELLNLAKLGSSNGLLPEATGHRAVCAPLQIILELSLRIVIPCGICPNFTGNAKYNGRHFTDDIFKRIFFNQNVCPFINISPSFIPMGPMC